MTAFPARRRIKPKDQTRTAVAIVYVSPHHAVARHQHRNKFISQVIFAIAISIQTKTHVRTWSFMHTIIRVSRSRGKGARMRVEMEILVRVEMEILFVFLSTDASEDLFAPSMWKCGLTGVPLALVCSYTSSSHVPLFFLFVHLAIRVGRAQGARTRGGRSSRRSRTASPRGGRRGGEAASAGVGRREDQASAGTRYGTAA